MWKNRDTCVGEKCRSAESRCRSSRRRSAAIRTRDGKRHSSREREKSAKEFNSSDDGREGKGRKKGGRGWGMDIAARSSMDTAKNRGPKQGTHRKARSWASVPSSQPGNEERPVTGNRYGLLCPAPLACRSSRVHWLLPVTHVHFVKKPS